MFGKYPAQVSRVYIQGKIITTYTAGFLRVFVGNSEPSSFIVYKTIERYLPFRAKIEIEFLCHRENLGNSHTVEAVLIVGDAVDCPVIRTVLLPAPAKGFIVEVCDIAERPCSKKVLFNKADQPLDILCECSDKMSYTHHFFIRTFINYLMLITLFWRKKFG